MGEELGEKKKSPRPEEDTKMEGETDSINVLPDEPPVPAEVAEAPAIPEEQERSEIVGVDASGDAPEETDENQKEPEKPMEDKKEIVVKKAKPKKRKINMAWAAPPEDDPFAEPANYEDLTIGLTDLPASKRRREREGEKERKEDPERLPVERFEEIGPEPYGFEVEFSLPETVVMTQTMDFKNPQLISPMGVCSWQSLNGRNFTAVTNTHSERRGGKGQIELLESPDDTRMRIILVLPNDQIDCIEPTAVSALKKDGFVFLDRAGFTIINLREVGGRPKIVQKKSFRMLLPKKGPPMFSSRGKTGPCFGLFLSRKQEIGTFVNDEKLGPTLFWWNPHSGTHRIVAVNIPRYSQVRFAKHYGNIIALSDMNRNDFCLWLITITGELVKKIDLNREDVRQPAGITFDKNGKILLADSKGQRILYFTANGEYKGDLTLDPPLRPSQKRMTDISLDQRGILTILSLDKTLSLYKVNVPSHQEDESLVEAEDFDPYAETVDFEPDMKDASRVEASQSDFDKDMAAFGDDGEAGAFKWTTKDTAKESSGWGSPSKDDSGQEAGWKSKEKNNSGWGSSKESSASGWLSKKTSPRAARTRTPSPRKPLGATRTRSPSPAVNKPCPESSNLGNKEASLKGGSSLEGSQEEPKNNGWGDSSKPANDGWPKSAAPETSNAKSTATTGWDIQNNQTNEKSSGWGNTSNSRSRSSSTSSKKDDGWGVKSQQNDDWRKSGGDKEANLSQKATPWGNNDRSGAKNFASKNDDNEWGRPPSVPRERRDNNRGSRSSRSPSPGGRKPWGGSQQKNDWGNRSADTWGNKGGNEKSQLGSNDNLKRSWPAKTSTSSWANPTDSTGDKGSGGWGSTTEQKNSGWENSRPATEGWGNTSAKQASSPKTDRWGSSKSSSTGGWGNKSTKDDSSQKTEGWGAARNNSVGGWGNTSTTESSPSTSTKAEGWGGSSNTGGWGKTTDSEGLDVSKNNSGGGWGNLSTKETSRSRSNTVGNSSPKNEGCGAPSGTFDNTSGWGSSNQKSSDSSWGGSKKETSTGWGNSGHSSSPAPTSAGWGSTEPQKLNLSGGPVWNSSDPKAKPPPGYVPPVYIPPDAPQRRRWESKEEPVEVPSAKFLETIKPNVPPRDPRLKKRISLDAYKQRPAPPVPQIAVIPLVPRPEDKKQDVKLPDAPSEPNPELNESLEEPPSPPSPAFEPAETFIPVKVPEDQILTAEQEEEFQKSILQDLEN